MDACGIILDPDTWGTFSDKIQSGASIVSLLILLWSLKSLQLISKQNALLKEQNEAIKDQTKLTKLQMSDANMPCFESISIIPAYDVYFIPGSQTALFQLQNIGATAYKISISTRPEHLKCTVSPLECSPGSWISLSVDTSTAEQSNELSNPITAFLQFENFLGDRFTQRAILSLGQVSCTSVERINT